MEKLKQLIDNCKCSVSLKINGHKDYYQSVSDYLFDLADVPNEKWQQDNGVDLTGDMLSHNGISIDEFKEMVRLDTVIEIQCYPETPIGFFTVIHYDLDKAIDTALS